MRVINLETGVLLRVVLSQPPPDICDDDAPIDRSIDRSIMRPAKAKQSERGVIFIYFFYIFHALSLSSLRRFLSSRDDGRVAILGEFRSRTRRHVLMRPTMTHAS